MPRYIDIEPEIQELQSVLDERKDDVNSTVHYTFRLVLRKLKCIPAADVAPRAEVAREIFEEIEKVLEREYTEIDQRREHITDPDALDGMDGELCGLDYATWLVTELKKKYTGGE